jgi:hypothetical protein
MMYLARCSYVGFTLLRFCHAKPAKEAIDKTLLDESVIFLSPAFSLCM